MTVLCYLRAVAVRASNLSSLVSLMNVFPDIISIKICWYENNHSGFPLKQVLDQDHAYYYKTCALFAPHEIWKGPPIRTRIFHQSAVKFDEVHILVLEYYNTAGTIIFQRLSSSKRKTVTWLYNWRYDFFFKFRLVNFL